MLSLLLALDLPTYLSIFIKLFIGGASILIYMNVSGRTQLSQMNAVDLISNFILGAIIGGALLDIHVTLYKYTIVLVMAESMLLLLHNAIQRSDSLRRFIIGRPIPIIRNGQFLMDEIQHNKKRVDILNIASQLNSDGILSFDDIYYAQIEPNGDVTAICDKKRLPAKLIIYRGAFCKAPLSEIEMTEDDVKQRLASFGINDIAEVFLCEYKNNRFQCITNEGNVYPPRDWREAKQNDELEKQKAKEETANQK